MPADFENRCALCKASIVDPQHWVTLRFGVFAHSICWKVCIDALAANNLIHLTCAETGDDHFSGE